MMNNGGTVRCVGRRVEPADREVWRHIAEMWFSDENHDRFHEACEAIDVSPPQLKALLSLRPGDGQTMRSLAQGWRCDASWVTGIVDGLEDRGYAARRAHATDRRVKVVEITDAGAKAKAEALEQLYHPPAALRERLTAAELSTLRDLLRKLADPD